MNNNGSSGLAPFFWGALAGGIVGAAIGLLYAPASGEETRKEVGDKVDDITDTINRILHSARNSADKMLNEGRERADEMIGRTRERVDDLMEDADRAMDEARHRSTSRTASKFEESDGSLGSQGTNGGYPSGVDNSKL
jgi:gas vesicle protein